jgi:Tat protein translocase TatB subunit
MDFFGIGGWELVLIFVVILIVVGPGKLPEIARTIGKTIRAVRKASADITTAVSHELDIAEQETKSHLPSKENQTAVVKATPATSPPEETARDRQPIPPPEGQLQKQ